ncbi:MAG: hypothetical protein JWP97_1203, partial [Labilithrix sp.]|nr:hypothetical protein [Labilithrix sp.]
AHVAGAARPLSSVASLAAARARRLVGMVAPLAAVAAALFFFVRTRPDLEVGKPAPRGDDVAGTASVPTLDRVQMGEVPSPGSPSSHEPETTFKGGMQLAVVRDRRGDQARFAGGPALRVRPGDRLRVEVALDREEAILGGVLADDGEYLELMPLAVRGPGTHLSERSAKIDASPSSGTIVIGTPEAIARVRATRQIAGVAAVRVEWEGGQ